MKRKYLQLLICLIVISFLLTPVFAFGYVKTGDGEATLLQEGEYDVVSKTHKDYATTLKAVQSLDEFVYNALLGVSSTIDVSAYSISVDDISAVYSNVINDHPDLFYVSSSFRYSYYSSNNTVARITPQYAMTAEQIEEAKEIYYSGAEKALSSVDDSMNSLQKAITVHDYICNLANYPSLYDSNGNFVSSLDKDIYHSAYGFFYNNKIVCAGYTLTYSYLLSQLGIPCEYVASDDMGHAWNKIEIDGSWYNVDLTFDDFNAVDDETTYGAVSHNYFLKSDAYYESANIQWHYGGKTGDSCDSNDTTYDEAFWDNVNSRIYIIDGKYYYLKPNSNYSNVYLKERALSGSEETLASFNTVSLSYSGSFEYSDGQVHRYSFSDALGRLTYLDNKFYVAADKSIYSVVNKTKYKITSISNYPTGISDNDKGNLYYHVYGENNALNELDKAEYFKNHVTHKKGENYNNFPDVNSDLVINGKDYASILRDLNN